MKSVIITQINPNSVNRKAQAMQISTSYNPGKQKRVDVKPVNCNANVNHLEMDWVFFKPV